MTTPSRRFTLAALSSLLALAAPAATARGQTVGGTILVNTHPAGLSVYGGLHHGGWVWAGMTSLLDAAYGPRLTKAATLGDRDALLAHDALWVDQRWSSTPDAGEMENLAAFIQTGRRVVIVGENASWGPWNAKVLAAVGGKEGPLTQLLPNQGGWAGPGCQDGPAARAVDHALTRGVERVNMACGGYALGGTSLFDYGVATLWGPADNVLTILDANILDDRFGTAYDGRQFRRNVVGWISDPAARLATVPEPTTLALAAAGLLGLGITRRRRVIGEA